MAKTIFSSGTIVLSAWLNSIFNANGGQGHRHDSVDGDGSCEKINLAAGAEVKGLLPTSMLTGNIPISMLDYYTTGTVDIKVTTPYFDVEDTDTWSYAVFQNFVLLLTKTITGHSTANNTFQVTPGTTWPAAIIPTDTLSIPATISREDDVGGPFIGRVRIPNSVSGDIICYVPNAVGDQRPVSAGFGYNKTFPKGIHAQPLVWMVS